MTPADLVKLARAAKSGKKVTSGLSAAKEAATISNMQQAGELPLSAAEIKRASSDVGLKIKPPSDNIVTVRQANFQYPKTIGNQTVSIDKISGGVRLSDPNEVKRVKALAKKIASPEGYISRIIVDHNNNVIEGQHRLEALRELGVKDVPVYKIEELADTMPVDKMEAAVQGVGAIHSDHVGQIVSHALEHISEEGIDGARKMNYGRFQKHYNAALDAIQSGSSPVIDRDANLANFLEPSQVKQRLYHGTTASEGGKGQEAIRRIKASKEGALGSGVYLTPKAEFASSYAEDIGGNVLPVHAQMKNPLILRGSPDPDRYKDPMIEALELLGMDTKKATNLVEKAYEDRGYIGKQVQSRAQAAGYDGLIEYDRNGEVSEVVSFNPNAIKSAIGNQGTYDIKNPDLNKAQGGLAHMSGGGKARTRAGTIAQPTFIDEQIDRTRDRLSKLYNDPDQALRDIARQYFPSSTDTPAQQQQKLEDLALGFAGSIKTPKAPKSPSSTGGDYLPGVHYHDPLQPAEMTFSEALGNAGAEGKTLNFTEADRSRVFGSNRGGVGFSGLQHYSEPHAEAGTSWGFGNKLTAEKKIRQNDPEKTIWTTFVGAPTQHRSNTVVLQDAISEFHNAVSQNKVHPAQINLINARIRSARDPKTKALLFDKSFDLTDPNSLSEATTFSRRSAIGDALLGEGVKGEMRKKGFKEVHGNQPWSDAGKMESILQRETDPDLVNAGTYDVGNRLFTMSGDIVQRPDLNFAFPWQTTGIDLGFKYIPTRKELAMRDWMKQYEGRVNKSGKPAPVSYMDLARNNPSQFVSEEYLNFLRKHGFKKGGLAHMAGGGTPEPKRKSILDLTPLTEAAAAVQNAFKAERSTYGDKGAAMDILNRGIVADTLGGAADLANLPLQGLDWLQSKIPGLSKPASVMDVPSTSPRLSDQPNTALKFPLSTDAPFGGSEAWKELFKKSGVTSKTERPVAEISTSLLAPLAPVVASKAAKVAKAVAPRAGDLAYQFINKQAEAMGLPLEMGVMKPKGGNWLAGSIERVTEPMKTPKIAGQTPQERIVEHEKLLADPSLNADQLDRVNYHLDVTKGEAALDKWVDKKLNPYIKNEMGTPEDQIRLGIERRYEEAKKLRSANQAKLDKMAADIDRNQAAGKDTTLTQRDYEAAKERFAEDEDIAFQGLYHGTVPEGGWMGGNVWEPRSLQFKREKEGFPKGGMGTHPAAKQWEASSDAEIGNYLAKDMQAEHLQETPLLKENEWINKVSPETKIYKLDEMNPDVGLEFRHMIDEVKTAMDPASNLPKHLKIAAKDLEKMTVDDVSALSGKISAWRNAQKGKANLELANNPAVSLYKEYPTANNPKGVSWRQIKRPEGLPDEEADKALRDAIGYEGDIMRHCVGGSGHCEPLLRGDTEVYSLRDAKGEPHVTIEVGPDDSIFGFRFAKENYPELYAQYSANKDKYFNSWRDFLTKEAPELLENIPKQIVEIKGKNNRKPKDEYIPFIQDFIKSGNWSNVGDLHHTDLRQLSTGKYATDQELKSLLSRHYPDNSGMTPTNAVEHYDLMKKHPEYQDEAAKKFIQDLESGNYFAPPEGMKRGGAVRMAEGGSVPKAPSNWTDYLSQHAQEESMRLMGGDTALNPMKDGGSINLDDMIRNAVEKANSRNYASGGAVNIDDLIQKAITLRNQHA